MSTTTLSPARRKRVAQRFEQAMRFQQAGNLTEAERGLRRIVETDPHHSPALHALALLRHRQGRRDEAIALMRDASRGHDADASLFNNLGNLLREAGREAPAIEAYREALARDPRHLNARFNLATLLMNAGDADGARDGYARVLEHAPGDVAVLMGLARALLALGRGDEALARIREAAQRAPDDPGIPAALSQALLGMDRVDDAVRAASDALARWPDDLPLARALATAQLVWEDYAGAEATLRRLLERRPDDVDAHTDLVRALVGQWRLDDALAVSDAFIDAHPQSADGLGSKGIALKQAGRLEEAVAAFERALELEPRYVAAWSNLGQAWIDLGDLEQAGACLERALELEPDLPEALFNVVRTRRNGPEHLAQVERIEALAASGRPNLSERMSLHFALGKAFDDLGDYDRAFAHYDRGNALKRLSARFVPEKFLDWVQGFHDTFTADFFRGLDGVGSDSERPVFIVGMPRSGTTLVEQILASHPQVFGADELDKVSTLADSIPARLGAATAYPRAAGALDPATVVALGREYLAHIGDLDAHSTRVTDKMPSNFFHLGLIAVMLPRARIIHCRRNPMDACFSNFIQLFGNSHFYSYSLEHVAVYYREYVRIMAHWREALPLPVHEVSYEALVEDPEGQTRAMLEHLALPWDDACLDFHRTRRAVRTASHWQVRQPIYRSARQRWRRYEKHLCGLAEQIGYDIPPADRAPPAPR